MKKYLFSSILIFTLVSFVFINHSYSNRNFAPTGRTNAPGEQTCANGCHSSFALQENMQDRISITVQGNELDASFEYVPGTTYDMNLSIVNPKDRNGFSLTTLDASDNFSGTLSTSSNNAQVTTGGARSYVGHTNSLGVSSWDFQWTAPSDSQQITVYSVANLSNNNNATNGDSILAKTVTFTAQANPGSAIKELEENVLVYNTPNQSNIRFDIEVVQPKTFHFELLNLAGQQVWYQQSVLHGGYHQISVPVGYSKGIYLLRIAEKNKAKIVKVML